MLQRLGDALKGNAWLKYVILVPLAVIFAAWGAYGIVNLRFGGSDAAAKVNGESIPLEEVRKNWLNRQAQAQSQFGAELPPALKARLQDEVLETFIERSLIRERTRKLGYRVSEAQMLQELHSIPAFQVDGRFSADAATARLQQVGISKEAFQEDLREGMQAAQVETGIRVSDFLTPRELERMRSLEDEQRQVRYALLPVDQFSGNAPIDDAAISAYYEKNKSQFMTPEFVRVKYAELKLDQLTAQTTITDADLKAFYDKNKDRYVAPEQRHARHILIQTSKTLDDAAARKRAEEVLAKVKAGGDFAALAKQYSNDAGSAAEGGDLGWSTREGMVAPEVANVVFGMNVNDVGGPVKTQFGYHILRLDGIQAGKVKTLEEARAEIEPQLKHDRAIDRFGDAQEQIQQKMEQSTPSLDSLAKSFDMQTGEVPQFVRGAGGGALGNSPELQQAVFSDAALTEHRVGGPVLLGEDRLVVVQALEHHTPTAKPLAEVKDAIVSALRRERGTHAADAAAQAAVAKLRSGTSFEDVLRELKVSADPARFVGRTDPSIPAQIRTAAFLSAKPAKDHPVYRALTLNSGSAILAVLDVKSQPEAQKPDELATLRIQAADQHGAADAQTYIDEMRRTAKVVKNPQAFE